MCDLPIPRPTVSLTCVIHGSKSFSQFCALWITKCFIWEAPGGWFRGHSGEPSNTFWTYKTVYLFALGKNVCFLCSMSSKSWTSETPPAESGGLLNRKLSSCLSWSTLILSPTRSPGREGTVCCTSSWASAKEAICTESSKSNRGGFCLRVGWWSGLFRSPWLCRYCRDLRHPTRFKVTGWQVECRKMLSQMLTSTKCIFF